MLKLVFITLQILIAINLALTRSPFDQEVSYLGRWAPTQGDGAVLLNRDINENDYYVSNNAGSWNSAEADCKRILGSKASIVSIETKEKWDFLKIFLEGFGFATDYWTGGIYDKPNGKWLWTGNSAPLFPSPPWDKGYPLEGNAFLRVLIRYENRNDAKWQTVSATQLHRYICEMPVADSPIPCRETNDLAIVLDSSGSIGNENYEKAKQFVERLASSFTEHKESRFSFITYSSNAKVQIELTNTLTPKEISSKILSTKYDAGTTATNLGIDLARKQLTSNKRGVPMNMIVLTDGQSNSYSQTTASANEAAKAGIRTFAVGITPSINREELLTIAGGNKDRVFTTTNFDQLIELLTELSVEACKS